MRYSLEPRKLKYVKRHGFFSFAKKTWRKKAGIVAAKNFFKRIFQKTAEATGDLI